MKTFVRNFRNSMMRIVLIGGGVLFPCYAHAGTNAVNVTSYGAVCDGTTDDTAAINSAIASVTAGFSNTSGGQILFPSGVCVVNGTITLQNVSLVGAEIPHFSDAPAGSGIFEAGTTLSIGTAATAPSTSNAAFVLGHSVTFKGLNIIYPYQISHGLVAGSPVPAAPTITDNLAGTSNILFENVHVVGAYDFWIQNQGPSPTYGNIRFVNSDVYAIRKVFDWSNVQETVSFSNFISNPSLCNGGSGGCSDALKNWTSDNGIWFHVGGGTGSTGYRSAVGRIVASNLTVASYRIGVLVDSDGHLDETVFGPTAIFDGVPQVLYVNSNGSITHTRFSGKAEFRETSRSGTPYGTAAFTLNNPQHPLPGDLILDHNTLSLNGFEAEGVGGSLLEATVTTGDIGAINITGAVVRGYCSGAVANAIYISTPNNASRSTSVIISGSQITTGRSGCGGAAIATNGAPYINSGNIIGYYPLN